MSKEFESKVLEFIDNTQKNFENMQKQMDERFGSMQNQMDNLEKNMDERFGSMQKQMDERFGSVQKQMDERFGSMQKQMDERFGSMQNQIDNLEKNMNDRFDTLTSSVVIIEDKVMTELPALFEAFEMHLERHKDYDDKNANLSAKVEENSMRISVLEDQIKFVKRG